MSCHQNGMGGESGNLPFKIASVSDDGLGPSWMLWRRRRYTVALMAFLGFMNVYSLRVNLSVAIVAMTSNYTVILPNGTVTEERDFDWDSRQVGFALSSFFYGYIFTQLPGGWLASRFGGNNVFCIGVAATSVLTLITPLVAKFSFGLFIAVRIIEGVFEGAAFPCIHAVWSKWAPPLERSKLAAIAFSGNFVGTVVAMPLCGHIANALGWEAIFYIFGLIGISWCIAWWIIVKKAPRYDSKITKEELHFIETSIGDSNIEKIAHPWMSIVKSPPVWAIVVAHTTENWGFYTLLTQLPSFMHDTLNFKVAKAGFLSGLPYLAMAIILVLSGQVADYLRSRQILSTTVVRKLFNCSAFLAQTVFMVLAAYLGSAVAIVTCLVIAVGMGGCAWTGFAVNHLDIAPQHASVLLGFSNTFGTLPGIISPLLTGYITTNHTPEEWDMVFYIAGSIYLFGAIIYGVFASGELQPWAKRESAPVVKGYDNIALEHDTSTMKADANSKI